MHNKPHLLLIASAGGHFKELSMLRDYWEKYDRTWVTFESMKKLGQLTSEKNVIYAYSPTNFPNIWNNIKNTFLALPLILSGKYTHIITTGAGIGVPFIWLGWLFSPLLKTKTIFIDSLTRTTSMSFSLKLVYFFSHIRLTQWKQNAITFPRLLYKGKVM